MEGRESSQANSLFFACSLIDYIARRTKNKRKDVVNALGEPAVRRMCDLADVYHSDNIDDVADSFIREGSLACGDFDNVAEAKYTVPSHWDIGKVYKRLILGVAERDELDCIDALFRVYNSPVSDLIDDYNGSFYYDPPQNILNAYYYGVEEQ